MEPVIKVERKHNVALVILNRPDSLNSVNVEMRDAVIRN